MTKQPPLDIKAIMRRLPHRYPFLMIDRVLKYGGDEVVAIKNVSLNEGFFSGHFPGEPVMPGVMIGECMAQSAAFLGTAADVPEREQGQEISSIGLKAFLTSIDLKLKHVVVPGDQLMLTTRAVRRLGKMMRVNALASVDGRQVAEAEFTVVLL